MDKEWLQERIAELTEQEQVQFANWQRTQGAKLAYQQVLAEMEKNEPIPKESIGAKEQSPA